MAAPRSRWIAGGFLVAITFLLLFRHQDSLRPAPLPSVETTTNASDDIDWSRFAYIQYATNSDYLCNSVMFFEALHRFSSHADRALMHPSSMLQSEEDVSDDARLLIKARDEYNVTLIPVELQYREDPNSDEALIEDVEGKDVVPEEKDMTWADSFTKLLAFKQTQYDRVLSVDSDTMLLQDMDELFLMPSVPVAMPRAYWLWPEKEILSSLVVLIEPSEAEFARIEAKIDAASENDYDMEIVNYLYRDSALVLPHRKYAMLTGEFRGDGHSKYLGSDVEIWDPAAVYNEAKLVHFSDWPLPKPWLDIPEQQRLELQPKCAVLADGAEDCTARIIWNSFYTDFKAKRKEVCDASPNMNVVQTKPFDGQPLTSNG